LFNRDKEKDKGEQISMQREERKRTRSEHYSL